MKGRINRVGINPSTKGENHQGDRALQTATQKLQKQQETKLPFY